MYTLFEIVPLNLERSVSPAIHLAWNLLLRRTEEACVFVCLCDRVCVRVCSATVIPDQLIVVRLQFHRGSAISEREAGGFRGRAIGNFVF